MTGEGDPSRADAAATLHASCVAVGEAGVLIRGPSGAGKSTLARRIVAARALLGGFGRLVGDDRIRVERRHGRLVARPVAAIAGRIEVRGVGLVPQAHEGAAVLRLVVDLLDAPGARMPEEPRPRTLLLGVALPLLALPMSPGLEDLVLWRIGGIRDADVTG